MPKKCLTCKTLLVRTNPRANNKKFCSITCRNKSYQKRVSAWQLARYDRLASVPDANKLQCLICGRWYVQVGSHVWNRHNMTAREYREYHELEVKRGITPSWYRQLKGEQSIENGTWENLKKGAKFRFKPGQKGVGVYKRSPITMARLSKLHKLNKKGKK